MTGGSRRVPPLLVVGFVLFLAVMAVLIVPSLVSPNVSVFAPTPTGGGEPAGGRLVAATLTVDAGDEHRWLFVSLDRGAVLEPSDTSGWDLAFQRFHIFSSGGIADLGPVSFESVGLAPDTGYVATTFGRDTSNAAIAHWYAYSYFSHLLTPKRDIYALRTRSGRHAKVQILGYYCAGPTPGCVTIRYVYQGNGTNALR